MRKFRLTWGILIFIGIGICVKLVLGTAQFSDELVYWGKKYDICSNPLEPYFEKYPERRPKAIITSSGLWRGYIASWDIKEGRFGEPGIEQVFAELLPLMKPTNREYPGYYERKLRKAIVQWNGLIGTLLDFG